MTFFGMIFSDNIAGIFTNDEKILRITSNLIKIWFFVRPIELTNVYMDISLRIIKKENIQFLITIFIESCSSFFLCYFFINIKILKIMDIFLLGLLYQF